MFLFVLLAGSFVPSVLAEFDSSRLLAAIHDAISDSWGSCAALLPSGDEAPAADSGEAAVSIVLSADAGIGAITGLAINHATVPLPPPRMGRHEWPPGPAASPRAPPPAA